MADALDNRDATETRENTDPKSDLEMKGIQDERRENQATGLMEGDHKKIEDTTGEDNTMSDQSEAEQGRILRKKKTQDYKRIHTGRNTPDDNTTKGKNPKNKKKEEKPADQRIQVETPPTHRQGEKAPRQAQGEKAPRQTQGERAPKENIEDQGERAPKEAPKEAHGERTPTNENQGERAPSQERNVTLVTISDQELDSSSSESESSSSSEEEVPRRDQATYSALYKKLEDNLTETKKELTKKRKENKTTEKEIRALKKELREAKKDEEKLEKTIEALKRANKELRKDKEHEEKEKESLKIEAEQLRKRLQQEKKENERQLEIKEEIKKKKEELQEKLDETKKQLRTTTTKLKEAESINKDLIERITTRGGRTEEKAKQNKREKPKKKALLLGDSNAKRVINHLNEEVEWFVAEDTYKIEDVKRSGSLRSYDAVVTLLGTNNIKTGNDGIREAQKLVEEMEKSDGKKIYICEAPPINRHRAKSEREIFNATLRNLVKTSKKCHVVRTPRITEEQPTNEVLVDDLHLDNFHAKKLAEKIQEKVMEDDKKQDEMENESQINASEEEIKEIIGSEHSRARLLEQEYNVKIRASRNDPNKIVIKGTEADRKETESNIRKKLEAIRERRTRNDALKESRKDIPCTFFAQNRCRKGDRCHFSHDKRETAHDEDRRRERRESREERRERKDSSSSRGWRGGRSRSPIRDERRARERSTERRITIRPRKSHE